MLKLNDKGEYKFTGVPAGNFVVNLNYSSPSKENLTKVFADKNNQGRNILNAVQNADVNKMNLFQLLKMIIRIEKLNGIMVNHLRLLNSMQIINKKVI